MKNINHGLIIPSDDIINKKQMMKMCNNLKCMCWNDIPSIYCCNCGNDEFYGYGCCTKMKNSDNEVKWI